MQHGLPKAGLQGPGPGYPCGSPLAARPYSLLARASLTFPAYTRQHLPLRQLPPRRSPANPPPEHWAPSTSSRIYYTTAHSLHRESFCSSAGFPHAVVTATSSGPGAVPETGATVNTNGWLSMGLARTGRPHPDTKVACHTCCSQPPV